jgi:uncharacterized protein
MDPLGLPDSGTLVLLIAVAFVAGWVDAVSGGGGLLQLPTLLIVLPEATPVEALATNKTSSMAGTAAATATYTRRVRPDVRTALPMVATAIVGSALGALTARTLPAEVFRPIIVALLAAVWLWTLARPAMGMEQRLRWEGRRRHYWIAALGGLVIGFYDGMLGPGTGSFLLILLVGLLGYSFLNASSTAKVVNLGTNAAAMVVFALSGSILWLLGLCMALGNVLGGVIGARTAMRRGSGFVRLVFLIVVGVLILRLGWDLVG